MATSTASPAEREVNEVCLEVESLPEGPSKRRGHRRRDFDRGAALVADQVRVPFGREVVHRRPVRQVAVDDDAESGEVLEGSIDGALVDIREGLPDAIGQLARRHVAVVFDQLSDDRATRCRDASALGSQPGNDGLDLVCHRLMLPVGPGPLACWTH